MINECLSRYWEFLKGIDHSRYRSCGEISPECIEWGNIADRVRSIER